MSDVLWVNAVTVCDLAATVRNQRTLLGRYELCLTDIAAASNHKELCEAILKHKDVFREVWGNE